MEKGTARPSESQIRWTQGSHQVYASLEMSAETATITFRIIVKRLLSNGSRDELAEKFELQGSLIYIIDL